MNPLRSVYDPGARSGGVRIAVDDRYGDIGEELQCRWVLQRLQLLSAPIYIEPAQHDHRVVRIQLLQLIPLMPGRMAAGQSTNIFSACCANKLRSPVPGEIQRLQPLDTDHALIMRQGSSLQSSESTLQAEHELLRLVSQVECFSDTSNIGPDAREISSLEREHSGRGTHRCAELVHFGT